MNAPIVREALGRERRKGTGLMKNLFSRATGVPGLPALPLSLPQRVQLQAGSGQCWEATYSTAGQKKNTTTQFNGKGN